MLAFRQYHFQVHNVHNVLLGEVRGRLAGACGDMGMWLLLPVCIDTNTLSLVPGQIPRPENAISRASRKKKDDQS